LSNFVRATDNFQITTLAPKSDFSAVVRAIQSFGRLHVIASPRVLAENQNEAKIEITEKIPYVDSTATSVGSTTGVSTSTVEQVEFETVGIRLSVTPILGSNDEVTLKIHQDVSEVVDFFKSVPVTDSRLIDTRFLTRDRQTIVIGGLMKERTAKNDNGIPLLMDIPLLGWLVSGKDTKREKIELLVFITPTVVEPGSIANVSSEYKHELVRKNREYRQDEYREFLDDVH
jgi:general secretion pathway protein D